ncbi:MAG: phage major capsid protein [Pseudomonadota bacterium]
MLESVKIQSRQSEIRQELSQLVGKTEPTEDEVRSLDSLDAEFRTNEKRYRAALIAESEERQAANDDFEAREDKEFSELVNNFELRQVALNLDEGAALSGQTAEVVEELRGQGGFRGQPVPWEALEVRNTTSTTTPDPIRTAPIIDRLFADSVAARMGTRMINVGQGELETPISTSSVSASWAATEGGNLADPVAYTTVDRPLKPDNTLGVRMSITRKALKQSGSALEQAIRRDMNGAISEAMDHAVFQGSGTSGQPTGILNLSVTPEINTEAVANLNTYGIYRDAATRLMNNNAINQPGGARILITPTIWAALDGDTLISGTSDSQYDRLIKRFGAGSIVMSTIALPADTAVMTAVTGGVAPIYAATWGAIDLIRDPYSDAASGGLRLTALATMDVSVSRSQQIEILDASS